ncbi:MAG: arginase family protein [Candidatus Dadabacteria bacterium]|nr:arginase family protein [Candidatus Dadabacteria bacterium]
MQSREWTILGVPIDCSGLEKGVERMPAALRAAGLTHHLTVRDGGDLTIALNDPRRDPVTGIIGYDSLCAVSAIIQKAVGGMLSRGECPLIIGGDCSLLVGVSAGFKQYFGRVGLVFVDGHLDFYDGQSSPTGEASDMELAILTGFGPNELIGLGGPPPLIASSDVVVLGYRDLEEAARYGSPDPTIILPEMRLYDVSTVLSYDPAKLGGMIEADLAAKIGCFWDKMARSTALVR